MLISSLHIICISNKKVRTLPNNFDDMKTNRVEIKTSDADEAVLQKAAEKFEKTTGKKGMTSRAILAAVEHYVRPEPILIFENVKALNEIQENIDFSLVHLQKIVDEYLAVANDAPTIEELQGLFGASSRTFLVCDYEAMKEQIYCKLHAQMQARYKGIKIIRANIDPPDFDRLVDVCAELIYSPCVNFVEIFYWGCFQIKDSKVLVLDDQVEKIKSCYKSFAATADEIKRLNDVQNLCDMLNSVFLSNVTSPLKLELPGLVNYNPNLRILIPGDQYVKYQL